MAGDEPRNQLTAIPRVYTIKEAMKEVKRQQSLPFDKQSKWVGVKTGNRVYFTGVK